MLFKDSYLLEKAYLSVSQPVPSVPSDEEELTVQPHEEVSFEPEIEVQVPGAEVHNPEAELSIQDECEEDTMAVDNLNSVRESVMKIAQFWATGGHLEPWQQQKLAIVMNSLAEIARSLH